MDKPEALRLAEDMERPMYPHYNPQAAAELRRLHEESEMHAAAYSSACGELRKVEAQCDALLELVVEMDQHEGAEGWSEDLRVKIDAAIKAVEEGK